jgi:hypothetical protein
VADVRATAIPSFKRSLPDLGVRASYVKVCGMLNSLGLELEVEACVLEEGSRFAVNGLSEPFYGPVHLRGIWLGRFPPNTSLKEYPLEFTNDVFPSVIVTEALNDLP